MADVSDNDTTAPDKASMASLPKINAKQTHLLALMTQNIIGKVEYDASILPPVSGFCSSSAPRRVLTHPRKPQWDAIAVYAGYKNVASAKKVYQKMRAKNGWAGGGDGRSGSGSGVAKAPKSTAATCDAPLGGGRPETRSKVGKRAGKPGSARAKAARGKKHAEKPAPAANEEQAVVV